MTQVGLGTGAVGTAPGAQARGSQGWRFDVVGVGVAIAPEDVVVEGAEGAVEATTDPEAAWVGAGVLTENWVPVTTVTSAPSATFDGS